MKGKCPKKGFARGLLTAIAIHSFRAKLGMFSGMEGFQGVIPSGAKLRRNCEAGGKKKTLGSGRRSGIGE